MDYQDMVEIATAAVNMPPGDYEAKKAKLIAYAADKDSAFREFVEKFYEVVERKRQQLQAAHENS